MDEADQAQFCIERDIEQGIRAVRKSAMLPRDGHCANCGDPIQAGLYCDSGCAKDHEARERLNRRAGVR